MFQITDNEDKMIRRMDRLISVLEQDAGVDQEVTNNVTNSSTVNVDEPDDSNTPKVYTTGPRRLAIPASEGWVRLEFGIVARTINVRTTEDIIVSFVKPTGDSTVGQTKVRASETMQESPFSIGGDAGIDTAFLWLKEADTAADTPGVEIIAYR